jgi:hypothetical protein
MCLPILAPIGAALGASAAQAAAVGTMATLGLATSAAGAAMSFVGQSQAASAQRYQYSEAQRLANENLQLQYRQMAVRQREEQVSKAQQVQQIRMEAEQAFGSIRAESGESGVYGNTVDILMREFERQQNESLSNLDLNYDFRNRQLQIEQLGMRGRAESAMIQAYPNQTAPSIITPLLQVGGSALNTVNMYGNFSRMPAFGGNPAPQVSSLARREAFVAGLPAFYRTPGMNRWY